MTRGGRDLDVVVAAPRTPWREDNVGWLRGALGRRRAHVLLWDADDAPGEASLAGLLERARVVVELRGARDATADHDALARAATAGAAVLTDAWAGLAPLVAGRDLLVARPRALGPVLDGLLEDDARREALAASLARRMPARAVDAIARPERERDVVRPPADARAVATAGPAGATTDPDCAVVLRTSGYRALAAPQVSVLLAVGAAQDPAPALLTAESAARAAGAQIEVVVVDDAPAGGFGRALRAFAAANEHLAVLGLRHRAPRGDATALATARAFARAPWLMPLAPAAELSEHAFARLIEASAADPGALAVAGLVARAADGRHRIVAEPLLWAAHMPSPPTVTAPPPGAAVVREVLMRA